MKQTKICRKCGIEKSFDEFHKCRSKKDGFSTECKECRAKYIKKYYHANSEREKERSRLYWRNNNQESRKIRIKEYRQKNAAKFKEYQRGWKKENPEKVKIYHKKSWIKKRLKPEWILNHRMSVAIRTSLKGNKKGHSWESIIRYSLEDLKQHLEKQFSEGMTWELFIQGEIQIDHKIPISLFNITSIKSKGFKKAWALENLQPMWAKENRMKRDKLFVA